MASVCLEAAARLIAPFQTGNWHWHAGERMCAMPNKPRRHLHTAHASYGRGWKATRLKSKQRPRRARVECPRAGDESLTCQANICCRRSWPIFTDDQYPGPAPQCSPQPTCSASKLIDCTAKRCARDSWLLVSSTERVLPWASCPVPRAARLRAHAVRASRVSAAVAGLAPARERRPASLPRYSTSSWSSSAQYWRWY